MKSKLTVFATIALATHSAHAANIFWADIAGNTNWTTGSSWVAIDPNPPTPPANSAVTDTATFTSVANAQPHLNVGATTRSVNGIDFQLPDGGLIFTSDAGATLRLGGNGIDASTQLSGDSAVNVTNIRVEGTPEWTLFSNTSNNSTSTFSVSSNIDLVTALTVRSNRNTNANNVGIVNLSGAISGTNSLSFSSPSSVRNTINLTGNSSYIGTTFIQQVALTANSLANAGSNSALGSSGTIVLGNNASAVSLTFQGLSADSSTDRLLSIRTTASNGSTLANNDPNHTISFTNPGNTGDLTATVDVNTVLNLGGTNTGNNTFGQIINDRTGTGVTVLRKSNAGTWVINNSGNTYTGATQVNGGLLRIDNAGSLGSGNLSFGGGVLGLAAGDMTARTLGTGVSQVQWTGSGGFAAFGADRTVSFATPATSLNWNATNFIGNGNTLILGHATADATLIWDQALNMAGGTRTVQVNDGAAAIDAKISRFITGGSSETFNGVLVKSGAGTLSLTANNFYSGDTNVNAGTLMIGDGGGTGGVSNASPNIIVASGATLAVNRNNTLTQGTANLITVISGDGGFAQVGSGTTEFALANVYTGPTTVSAGRLALSGAGSIDNSASVTIAGGAKLDTTAKTGTYAPATTQPITFGLDAAGAGSSGQIDAASLDITNANISFNAVNGPLDDAQYVLASYSGTLTGTFAASPPAGYTYDYGTGTNSQIKLVTASGSPYDTWAGGPGLPFDGDANGDGVSNGLAFLLGALDEDVSALNKLPTVTETAGGLVLNFDMRDSASRGTATLHVEHSSDLGVGDPWDAALVPDADNTVNDVVFDIEGSGTLDVEATIPASKASGGKLFGRLKAVKP